jgi:hypothetical protein
VRKAGVEALRERIKTAVPLATVYAEQLQETAGRDAGSIARLGAELAGIVARVTNEFDRDAFSARSRSLPGCPKTCWREARRSAIAWGGS